MKLPIALSVNSLYGRSQLSSFLLHNSLLQHKKLRKVVIMDRITVGSEVVFGRHYGEKTQGIVIKVNQKTFKIRATETRHKRNGTNNVGQVYNVSKSLVRLASSVTTTTNGMKVKLTGYSQPARTNYTVKPNLKKGDTVKFELKGSLVSTKVVRVNSKTVTTENGYRVPFGLLK